MAPPKMGPKSSDSEYTTDTELVYLAYFSGGTNSRNMTEQRE